MHTDESATCKNNRSGLLCGKCKPGYNLALGSSKCLHCSNNYILLFIPLVLAGIALVLQLLIFKLTVAAGTINEMVWTFMLKLLQSIILPTQWNEHSDSIHSLA